MSEKQKHNSRLLYEFQVASGLLLNGGIDVSVANSSDRSQSNPDILCNYLIEGIACKVVGTANVVTVTDRIMEGADQIAASSAQMGMVALNLTSSIEHDNLFPTDAADFRIYNSLEDAASTVHAALNAWAVKLLDAIPTDVYKLYTKRCGQPAFVLTAGTTLIINTPEGRVPYGFAPSTVVGRGQYRRKELLAVRNIANWVVW